MAARLAGFVHVDGVAYGPDSDVPADVAKRIVNPDAWEGGEVPSDRASQGEKPASKASRAKSGA